MKTTRVLAISDLHCGHRVGLTPPDYQQRIVTKSSTKRQKWYKIAAALWREWDMILREIQPIDRVLFGGDGPDGKGNKSGGVEQLTTKRDEQVDMAVACFDHIRMFGRHGKQGKDFAIVGVYGTDYHVSTEGDDWEESIADKAGFAKIGAHEWVDVNGCVFDLKHKVGNTSIPHGKGTAITKEWLMNALWAARDEQPQADVILRGHVHRFFHVGDADFLGMTLPSLQGMGSRYGARQCSMPIDWGMVHFDIDEKGKIVAWHPHIVRINEQKAQVVKI